MKQLLITCFTILFSAILFSQETDTIPTVLDDVIIVSERKLSNYTQEKTLSSVDVLLDKTVNVNMIKRGNYAWEPSLNNMASERLSVTIDGMQIYGACTDKMDPITSYVDVSNLEKATITSGQQGTENANTIGGAIDLMLPVAKFKNTGFQSSVDLGYETNGSYKTTSIETQYNSKKFYLNTDGIYRESNNYYAGNKKTVNYSQFEKYNISLQTAYKLNKHQNLEAAIIHDRATNVGYPALPMDVSLAKATIASVAHNFKCDSTLLKNWETKLYINNITHIMDDSKRPNVPIRMDMPGWSNTYGMYSKATLYIKKHLLSININSHYNQSLAEMTMFPNNPNENDMFMYTWPDIRTMYSSLYLKDSYHFNNKHAIEISTRLGYHKNTIKKEVGIKSLQIFYPNVQKNKVRVLPSISGNYTLNHNKSKYLFSIGYGERAPSVSEAYGFYLFNSFDNYDYIGNPNLNNEKAIEINFAAKYNFSKVKLNVGASCFNIYDYIIGKNSPSYSAMTIGASGVRTYHALNHAQLFNSHITSNYSISKKVSASIALEYHFGKAKTYGKLPLISPFSYRTELNVRHKNLTASLQLVGNANQYNYSSIYGENQTPSFAIINLNFSTSFLTNSNKILLKYGVENILDSYYSTYADWNNVPRPGRNFFLNASYIIF